MSAPVWGCRVWLALLNRGRLCIIRVEGAEPSSPTCVGSRFPVFGRSNQTNGSSPASWGTLRSRRLTSFFIPAGAGKYMEYYTIFFFDSRCLAVSRRGNGVSIIGCLSCSCALCCFFARWCVGRKTQKRVYCLLTNKYFCARMGISTKTTRETLPQGGGPRKRL